MSVKRPSFFAIAMAAFSSCLAVLALQEARAGQSDYRYTYRGTEVPEYLAFNVVARTLVSKYQEDPVGGIVRVQNVFGTTLDSTSEELVQELNKYLTLLDADNRLAAKASYCHRVATAPTDKSLFLALDNVEDGRHVRMMKHYENFLSSLNNHNKTSLSAYLAKQSVSYYAIDHKSEYEKSSKNVRSVLAEYCNQINKIERDAKNGN